LLADAFYTNPAHVYLCPDPDSRHARLRWLLGGNLRMCLRVDPDASFCVVDGVRVDAVGFWTRPGAPAIGIVPKLRSGACAAPLRLGVAGVRQLAEVTREIGRSRAEALGDRPHWYLNNMVVRESLRGSGLGSGLLRAELRAIDIRTPGVPIALATQREENVRFYRRLGFEVGSDRTIGRGPNAFRNWLMVRPPASAPAGGL